VRYVKGFRKEKPIYTCITVRFNGSYYDAVLYILWTHNTWITPECFFKATYGKRKKRERLI